MRNDRLAEATDAVRLINTMCEAFTGAVGTEMRFHKAPTPQSSDSESWHREIKWQKRTLGSLEIADSEDLNEFEESLAEILVSLTNRNLRTQHELECRGADFATLLSVIGTGHSTVKPEVALVQLMDAAIATTGFFTAAFFLMSPDMQTLRLRLLAGRSQLGVPERNRLLAHTVADTEAIRTGSTVVRRGLTPEAETWLPRSAATGCCVSVKSGTGPIGTLWLFDRRARSVSKDEIRILENISLHMSAVFERLIHEHDSQDQRRIQAELETATRELCFLGEHEQFQSNGLDVAINRTTHSELGGDLLELIQVDENRTVLAIGDATGHGIAAAMAISAVRGCIRTIVTDESTDVLDPASILERINRAYCGIANPSFFSTLFLVSIDTSTMTMHYANAGNPPPLFCGNSDSFRLDARGLPLGVTDNAEYQGASVSFALGDVLIGFSDGILEAGCSRNSLFRVDGIEACVTAETRGSAVNLLTAIRGSVNAHSLGMTEDDQSLVVVRFDRPL